MTRSARLDFPNGFFHVYNRGLNKQRIFYSDSDYRFLLNRLSLLLEELDHRIYCYCLMSNHYHFLIETRKTKLSKLLGRLFTSYGVYFNKKYSKNGPLFQDRYKSIVIQKDQYFLELSRYIHLNPVKVGLCEKPENYPYSSLGEIIEDEMRGNSIVHQSSISRLVGARQGDKKDYLEFVYQGINIDLEEYNPWRSMKKIFGTARFNTAQFKKIRR